MRVPLLTGYTFHAQSRTLNLSGVPGFDPRRLFTVLNITAAQEIYALAEPGLGYTAYANGVLTLACDTRLMSDSDLLFVIYEDGAAQLPPDAATNTKLEALRTTLATAGKQDEAKVVLQSILGVLQAQVDFEETVWTDPATGVFYVRRSVEAEGTGGYTVVYTDPTGAVVTPPAGIEPAARTPYHTIESAYFDATSAGTGYAQGDLLVRIVVFDTRTNTIAAALWQNMSQGTAITAPAAGSFVEQTKAVVATLPQLPTGLGPRPAGQSLSVTLAPDGQFAASVGLPADVAATSDGAAASLTALVKRALGNWTALLARMPPSVSGRVPTDGSGVIQPVSAAALPLPAGAAQDSTLQNILTGIGFLATHADEGAELSKLEAIRQLLAGTLTTALAAGSATIGAVTQAGAWAVTATLQAGTAVIGRVGLQVGGADVASANPVPVSVGNFPTTQPVSAAALPLPAGAAQDATLTARLGTLGQKTSAGSAPVVIASDQPRLATDTVVSAAAVSRSGTIASGGTAQQFMAANATRRGFVLQNQSSGDLWINGIGAATTDQNSLKVGAGAYYETPAHHVGVGAVSIIGATAGQAFYAREF